MAFTLRNLDPGASGKGAPNIASYFTTVDNAATGEGAGYFNTVSDPLTSASGSGLLFAVWSDASILYGYTVAAGVVTLDVVNKKTMD